MHSRRGSLLKSQDMLEASCEPIHQIKHDYEYRVITIIPCYIYMPPDFAVVFQAV